MKIKLIVLFSIAFMTASCGKKVDKSLPREKKSGYSIVIIEQCEYIEVESMTGTTVGYYSITHKGNCKNPIHDCKSSGLH